MFKRELKFNFQSFLVWTLIIILVYLVIFLVYPSIANSENIKQMDEFVKIFPPEVLKAFNMDIASIETVYGWLKSEGFIFILLIICSYAGITGSNILLKEESEKTIEYINSLPVKRNKIVMSKYITGIIYIVIMVLVVGVFNYVSLCLSGDFEHEQFICLSITPILPALVIYSLCVFVSTFAHKTKKMLGISLGIVFISYIFNTLAEIAKEVEFLKYFSAFTLADVRNVMIDTCFNPIMIIITILLSTLFLMGTVLRFNNKDLV